MQQLSKKLTREQSLDRVKALVGEAGMILRTLSPDYARVGWILEDALVYLDEVGEGIGLPELDTATAAGNALPKTATVNQG